MLHPIEKIHPKSLKNLADQLQNLIKGKLWIQVLIGMFSGILFGILLGPTTGWLKPDISYLLGEWLSLPGKIFLGLLQMIMIPLIFASIIRGLAASQDMEHLGKIGSRLAGYFILTTVIAIIIGLGVAYLTQPGQYISSDIIGKPAPEFIPQGEDIAYATPDVSEIPELIGALLPTDPVGAMLNREMLQVVILAIIIGIALLSMSPKQSKPILDLFGSLQVICLTIVRWAMLMAPIAVFGLLAQLTTRIGLEALFGMAIYVGTVLLGFGILLLLYLLIIIFFTDINLFYFIKSIRDVQLLAFSTSSSAAVMPLSIQIAEDKLYIRPSIAQLLIPLGATVNMNGTALYHGAATVFLAQIYNIELSLPALLLVVLTAVGVSIGSPATPGVGIILLSMVLDSVGIPTSGIALILGVDRILDMSRTAINVTGDLVVCAVMDKWVGGKKTFEQEISDESQRNQEREKTGEDVLTDE